jgi:bifunctional UDP-N-acetylglucosamine pyrophosphorylase/glucosamine-1-phosphate N-acetyltransferase
MAQQKKLQYSAVILAAGKGTRMKSPLPKVLHPVAGEPMISKIVRACQQAEIQDVRVVLGHGQTLVKSVLENSQVSIFSQVQQLGTADAVRSAQPESFNERVLILNGDHPLIEAADLEKILKEFENQKCDIAVVTCILKDPKSFGRIVRHKGQLVAIVEAKDASAETLKIREINTGIYIAKSDAIQDLLPQIQNQNAQREFYLTDLISLGIEQGYKVAALATSPKMALGVNNQVELAQASRIVYRRKAQKLMENGVLIVNPRATYVEESVQIGEGSVLFPNSFLRGNTVVGSCSVIEPNCFISDAVIGDGVQIRAGTYIEKSKIDSKVTLGPYARLRPETHLEEESHVGNFVEMKKVKFGARSKAGHLTYLGDAEVGKDSNIGCGTITCNYAVNKQKYRTKIGDRVFVGSDTQFVAPIIVGDDAVIGSGSTITKDVPSKALAVARGRQMTKENYVQTPELSTSTEDNVKTQNTENLK